MDVSDGGGGRGSGDDIDTHVPEPATDYTASIFGLDSGARNAHPS